MKSQIIITIVLTLLFTTTAYSEETLPASNSSVSSSKGGVKTEDFENFKNVTSEDGNWLECITSYLSELLLAEKKGEGWQYRKKILIDFQSYKNSKEQALKEKTDFSSSVISSGKGAMFFHMLKNLVGEDIFNSALREFVAEKNFSAASWKDIEKAFEKVSRQDLKWFFSQWLTRNDVPSFEVKDLRVIVIKGIPTVSFDIIQKGQPFKFSLPVRIITEKGDKKDIIQIEEKKKNYEIQVEERPIRIIFDESYDIMRRLTEKEFPPLLSRFFRDDKKFVVYSEEEKDKYSSLIDALTKNGFIVKEVHEVKDEDIRSSSLLVLGFESPILKRLFGKIIDSEKGFTVIVKRNPLNDEKVVAYAQGETKEDVDSAALKIFSNNEYSRIHFQKGEIIEKMTEESDRGISYSLYKPVLGINPKQAIKLEDIINTVIDKPVIYVGERHPNYEDHKVQLEVIMELFHRGRKFAIGMEMFQKPFQKALDNYLSGAINERKFLKTSEYFKRWMFDYNLYREIIEFAKAKGVPIIALNLREEIVKKVAEGGLDALTKEEREDIPQDMDMRDESYKERLEEVFRLHERLRIKNLDYFYQSQILWDETMAHSIAEFMNNHPGYQMVVMAGEQHVIYDSGIPQRTFRLNGKDYATLINGVSEELDKDIGDFVLFPAPMTPPFSPKLGVLLKEEDGKVWVEEFLPGSIAFRAGLKKGDTIVSVDDWKVESVEDVKIALFDKKEGDKINVKVVRKRFLFGKKVIEFNITL
jgi:aminopeptidase N